MHKAIKKHRLEQRRAVSSWRWFLRTWQEPTEWCSAIGDGDLDQVTRTRMN